MQDNDLDEARKRHTFYQSLIMEGKAMADIHILKLKKILPYSIAIHKYSFSPSYTSMLQRLRVKDARKQYQVDGIMIAVAFVAVCFFAFSVYSIFMIGIAQIYDELFTILFSLLILCLFLYGLFERRYAEHARYMIYTDPAFYRNAMDLEGAVRIFWILQETEVPKNYTLQDFPRISGHIQNEDVVFTITDPQKLRALLKVDTDIARLFAEASVKGYIFSTVTFSDELRAQHDFFLSNDTIFAQDVSDLFTADMHFFDLMHTKYLDTFTITTGSGKQQRRVLFVNP